MHPLNSASFHCESQSLHLFQFSCDVWQALDMFADLVRSSVDFAEARSNDDFMPGTSKKAVVSPLLNLSKLKAVQELVNEIKMTQQWKASGVGSKSKPPIDVKDLTNMNIEDFM